ncbi:MAG: acyl-CoA dehydrogenase family protein [Betaproteobacteria bacterium]
MNFAISNDQQQLLDAVDRFLDQRLPPEEVRRRDAAHQPPYDLLPDLGAMGILGLVAPVQWGGMGLDWITLSLIQERLAERAYFAGSIVNRVVGFGLMTLLRNGSPDQQARWLPQLIQGRGLMALALTESTAGSDAGAVQTRALPVAGGWLLRGRKIWISDANEAMALLVAARTNP